MNCDLDDRAVCRFCHRRASGPDVRRACTYDITQHVPPSILARGMHYAQAFWRWQLAGRPVRSPAEVSKLREMCAACPLFDGTICTHEACGCPVSRPSFFGDKLKWKTEHCPLSKW